MKKNRIEELEKTIKLCREDLGIDVTLFENSLHFLCFIEDNYKEAKEWLEGQKLSSKAMLKIPTEEEVLLGTSEEELRFGMIFDIRQEIEKIKERIAEKEKPDIYFELELEKMQLFVKFLLLAPFLPSLKG